MNSDISRLSACSAEATKEMTAEITYICKNMKNREPGSDSEHKTALYYAYVLENYYHTRRDSYDNLNPEGLENCWRATVQLVRRIDAGELDG